MSKQIKERITTATQKTNVKTKKLASSARMVFLVVPVIMIGLILVVVGIISETIADDTAGRMSRQYSIESASNFQIYMNAHMRLMQQMAYSATISRWLRNAEDNEARTHAFETMSGHAAYSPEIYFMFTVYETLAAYNFRSDMLYEDFHSWGFLSGGQASQWFFDTRDSEMPFIINIQRTRPDDLGDWVLYIWTNHRVYYSGEFVGVVTVGSPFDVVFHATFYAFDDQDKRGYIIDSCGNVRMDSAGELETTIDGLPAFPVVPESVNNPGLVDAIESHLLRLSEGQFPLGTPTQEAIRLGSGYFRYASISPIIGTDWAIMVLSGHAWGLDERYAPLIIITAVLLIAFVIIGSYLLNKRIITPIYKLSVSTEKIATNPNAQIFGISRNDEIGILARTIQEMREEISAQKDYEVAKQAQLMIDAAPLSITLLDKNLNTISCNKETRRIFGIENESNYESIKATMPEYQPNGRYTMDLFNECVNKAFAEGQYKTELVCQLRDGTLIPTEITWARIEYKGELVVVEYIMDLTEQKAAIKIERELEAKKNEQKMNERISIMFDAAPLIIEFWRSDYTTFDCNQTALQYYGIKEKSEYVTKLYSFFDNEHPNTKTWRYYIDQAFNSGSAWFEFNDYKPNGESRILEVYAIRMDFSGETAVITYAQDVTKVKELQREQQLKVIAEESNRAKSLFLARMSHEIRTPITAVIGIAEIELQNPANTPHTEESFAKIHNSANSLLSIVNDILDLSKIEAGKMEIINDEYEVASIILDAAYMHLIYVSSKNIKFRLHVDENLPTYLVGDSLRIGQIINNILSNAFKYTISGSVDLSLSCQKDENVDDQIIFIISIKDTGLGMSDEQLNDLSNDYTRYHEKDYRFISGTGLGMPIVYSLIKMMNADIQTESEVGKGTSMIVRIPQKIVGTDIIGQDLAERLQHFEENVKAVSKKFTFDPEPMPYGSVLIVDDVAANLYVAKGLMAFYGLSIETCSNGMEAVERIKQGSVYDIIFMDYMMPGMSGTEAMRTIRKEGYYYPIVALTANAMIGKAEEYINDGFDGFISKPIQTKHLNSILVKHIKDKQPPEIIEAAQKATGGKMPSAAEIESYQQSNELIAKLKPEFAANHVKSYSSMVKALRDNDIKTAHRIAHTLKSSAGLINEMELAAAAEHIEQMFDFGEIPQESDLKVLKSELTHVLEKIGLPDTDIDQDESEIKREQAEELFNKLIPLLSTQNTECLNFVADLQKIPGTSLICKYIQEFSFTEALKLINTIISDWEVN